MNKIGCVLLINLSLFISGCAGLSSALNLTHTERVVTEGQLLIVTELDAFNHWREIARSERARAAGVRILEVGENYISTYDATDDTIALIVLEYDSEDLCRNGEVANSSGPIKAAIEKGGMTVTGTSQGLLENCQKGFRTKVHWDSNAGINIGTAFATLAFNVRHVTTLKYKYKWMGTRCRDGWLSSSSGSGTCSSHGGVAAPAYRKVYADDVDKK